MITGRRFLVAMLLATASCAEPALDDGQPWDESVQMEGDGDGTEINGKVQSLAPYYYLINYETRWCLQSNGVSVTQGDCFQPSQKWVLTPKEMINSQQSYEVRHVSSNRCLTANKGEILDPLAMSTCSSWVGKRQRWIAFPSNPSTPLKSAATGWCVMPVYDGDHSLLRDVHTSACPTSSDSPFWILWF